MGEMSLRGWLGSVPPDAARGPLPPSFSLGPWAWRPPLEAVGDRPGFRGVEHVLGFTKLHRARTLLCNPEG